MAELLRAIEFFAGVGGLHYALRESDAAHKILRAYDVDDAAVRTYKHNLTDTPVSTHDIASLKAADIPEADLWLLSPPCQPYTRQGLQLAARDKRAAAMQHIIDLLELDEAEALRPSLLLLENVVGFESSATRQRLVGVLKSAGYCVREVWASPAMIGVPNQRTRYFLLARRLNASRAGAADSSGSAAASGEQQQQREALPAELPPALSNVVLLDPAALDEACVTGTPIPPPVGEVASALQASCRPLSDYLDPADSPDLSAHAVPDHILERYGSATDLVDRTSRRSCCFTKNYSRYIKGTGSLVCEGGGGGEGGGGEGGGGGAASGSSSSLDASAASVSLPAPLLADPLDKSLEALRPLRPRFFAPREIARIHGFPEEFEFPSTLSMKKRYELLGNSLSIQVVAALLRFLLSTSTALTAPVVS